MGSSLQADDLALARTGPPLHLSEETQAVLMVAIILALLVILWRTWR